ncbi:glycosyltransferase [Marinilongibacter aquaticus]|uniref:glycosyltransferase n=1 Tax=Marinilongibacter aquaticus TaxID=2975157 RepID=UPI0021BDBB64|nr:glycosyltransferase [Marinilongibacter aquaticus]UBM60031.1 glycosyltransferase [Marinilongibacter aquaticus]
MTDLVLRKSSVGTDLQKINPKLLSVLHTTKDVAMEALPEVLFLTTFPPRQCGIATYSKDLIDALEKQFKSSFNCTVCALESMNEQHRYGRLPKYILNTDHRNAFAKTAFKINNDENIKLVVIQHEFGFFAQRKTGFLSFLEAIRKPIVLVFHTVLPSPSPELIAEVNEMAVLATKVIVMTAHAANILLMEYNLSNDKINIIPHGTHLVPPLDKERAKSHYDLSERKVLSTFGLLGSSKSIETTLDALPAIIKVHPETLFLVLGKTHPTVCLQEGEQYREMLEAKVKEMGLEKHVRFVNEYLPLPILLEYLQLTDIYLFTSKDPNQAVSGTFSYAVSSGCPVISTPIPHAKEVLDQNKGLIIDFENHSQLADAVISLLSNEPLRKEISSISFHKMASTAWQNSAVAHALLFEDLTENVFPLNFKTPDFNLNHLKLMTTSFGMIQFAKISVPDIHSGYTLDDNARALIATCQYYEMFRNTDVLELITTYLHFIKHCFKANGKFLNYVNEQKEFTDQNYVENLEDSNGRAIWALGYVISMGEVLPSKLVFEAAILLEKALPEMEKIHSPRAMSFIIKGLYYQNKMENLPILQTLANRMVQMYKRKNTTGWHWFENYLTYGNSVLPEAMLCAYLRTDNEEYKIIAQESFGFLLSKTFLNSKIKVISNDGWLIKDKNSKSKAGGEQPIDVAYTIKTLEKFYRVFKTKNYLEKARIAFQWFLGDNHQNQIVYNPCTGGCYDGLEEHYVNLNQGAESTLSYLIARLAIENLQFSDQKALYEEVKEPKMELKSRPVIGIRTTVKRPPDITL